MSENAVEIIRRCPSITLDNVERICTDLRESEPATPLVVSLSHVQQIDTAGAQLLLCFAQSNHVSYRNCSPVVADFLSSTGLKSQFPISDDEAPK